MKRHHERQRIGAAIKAARERAGLTQVQVAQHLDIGPGAVSQMESKKGVEEISRILDLEDLFDLPRGQLFYESGLVPQAAKPGAPLEEHIAADSTITPAVRQVLLLTLTELRRD